jgi:hypothetical protein
LHIIVDERRRIHCSKLIKYLVETKKLSNSINETDAFGETPTYIAASAGHLNVLKYLVDEKKANVSGTSTQGFNLLHVAAGNGHFDVVKYLVREKGADVSLKTADGKTAEELAWAENHAEISKYLETVPSSQTAQRVRRSLSTQQEGLRPLQLETVMSTPRSTSETVSRLAKSPQEAVNEPRVDSSVVDGFLVLADVFARVWSGTRYQGLKPGILPSPRDIVRQRVDVNAINVINATNSLYDKKVGD